MQLRPTQSTIFDLVQRGLTGNSAKLVRAQEQTSSGRRILRPSDDAAGTSVAMSLRRQIGSLASFVAATTHARPQVEQAAARLEEGSGLVTEARALIIQGMNGSLGADDREQIASQLELVFGQLIDVANSQNGDRYLFSGTKTSTRPFEVETIGGQKRVVYKGNGDAQRILIGRETTLQVNAPGDATFTQFAYTETKYGPLTGVRSGTGGDSGIGYESLHVRQDGTSGTMSEGVALAGASPSGSRDTIVGDRALVIDAVAGTVQLGGGPATPITVPYAADQRVVDEHGAELHLDFTGWTGVGFATTVTGAASVSLDGSAYTALTLAETNLQVRNAASGSVVHIDATGIARAGREHVTFAGTPSLFDSIQAVVADLRNEEGVDRALMIERISTRLGELDRSQSDLLLALGRLGSTSKRIVTSEQRLQDLSVDLEGLVSNVEDADFAVTALDLTRAEQTLQLAQATGARIIQQTLLNFLR